MIVEPDVEPGLDMLTDDFESLLLSQLYAARAELRQQLALSPTIDHPAIREAITTLLSNGLRTFCWLEKQGRARAEP